MKVSTRYLYESFIDDIIDTERELYEIRKQIASGKKLTNPSDDPKGYREIVDIKTSLASAENYNKNIEFAKSWLETTEGALQSMNELLVRAKTIAVAQSNGTYSREDREIAAEEVREILNNFIQFANTDYMGRYIFSGYKSETPTLSYGYAYSSAIPDGYNKYKGNVTIEQVGNLPESAYYIVRVESGGRYSYSTDGGKTFSTPQPFTIVGSTAYATFDGLRIGIPSSEINNVGDRYHVSILGGSYQGDSGEIYVKTGDLESDKMKINVTADEVFYDTSEGYNITLSLRDLYTALKANNVEEIQEAIEEIDKGLEKINKMRGVVGERLNRITSLVNYYSIKKENLTADLSSREDVDIAEVSAKMAEKDTFYRALLAVFTRLSKTTLLDFLA